MKFFKKIPKNKGMTYIELIVVLSIFAIMSSVILFNYGAFQADIDIKNLASDIALQIVQAQRDAVSGLLPPPAYQVLVTNPLTWKPSYGVYFNIAKPKQFIYFVDVSNPPDGYDAVPGTEALNTISIQNNSFISSINECYADPCVAGDSDGLLSVTFTRPNSSAVIRDAGGIITGFSYVQITVASAINGPTALIKIYPSGRIQVN